MTDRELDAQLTRLYTTLIGDMHALERSILQLRGRDAVRTRPFTAQYPQICHVCHLEMKGESVVRIDAPFTLPTTTGFGPPQVYVHESCVRQ